jgi:hypothetical protein|nr:MAG TPA: Protein of unknown function (DUF1492) [Caudoviricetes sp.]
MCRSSNDKKRVFLEGVGYLIDRIESLERVLKAEEARKVGVSAIDYSKEQLKGGLGKGGIESLIDKTDRYKRDIYLTCVELVKRKDQVFACINEVADPRYSLLLTLRYIERLEWGEVEQIMGLTTNSRNVYHSKALADLRLPDEVNKVSEVNEGLA